MSESPLDQAWGIVLPPLDGMPAGGPSHQLLWLSKVEAQRELSRTIAARALRQRRLQDPKGIRVADVYPRRRENGCAYLGHAESASQQEQPKQ